MKKTFAFLILIMLCLSSCLKEKTVPIASTTDGCFEQSYTYNIRPIIETSCKTQAGIGCHDAWIDEYTPIASYISSGVWYTEIFIDKTMPVMPNVWGIDSLTEAELEVMQCWIDQGYPEFD